MIYKVAGKEKGTIICIHGNSSSSKVFENLLNTTEINQSIITVDLPGHGDNQKTSDELLTFSILSLKSFLLDIISDIDDEVLLIGNSLGGHLAIEIATEIKKLKGLVIMGTPPLKKPSNFDEAFVPVPELNSFLKEFPSDVEIEAVTEIAIVNKENKQRIIDDFKRSNPSVRSALAEDLAKGTFVDEYKIFTNLEIPKYIIAGDSDPSVNRSYLDEVKKDCKLNCEIFDLKECGHYPSIDRSDEFINIVKDVANKVF